MAKHTWDTVTIVGVGLMGGSIGLALRQRKLARHIIGVLRNPARARKVRESGAVTETTSSLATGAEKADLIVVCTPIEQVAPTVLLAARHCREDVLLTDVGSTKKGIVEDVGQKLGKNYPKARIQYRGAFIGSHPLAGSEKSGVEAARADLLEGRAVIITPTENSPPNQVARLEAFWKQLGARVYRQTPHDHDETVSAISHVPHVVSSALAAATNRDHLPFVGGGWLDMTRIAAGDVELWRQILIDNRYAVLRSLEKFTTVLLNLRHGLELGDDEAIVRILQAGKKIRDAVED